ncbi:kinesin-like protein KIN-14K isoform X2 [Lolium rigidum]|uniref:kinesin-like protein KIN-14K isoform X2 n=1 Tax=Lolium rigidum TaxID=89674 RepID=UPI001F5D0BD8|nr:kinesin-like protein KIN-14K isoform X2 [Lolium rigidum]
MGSVDGDSQGLQADARRAEVIKWLGALIPEYRLPSDSSDEELRELLGDGTALCHLTDTLIPGALEGLPGGYASSEQRSGNVKKFLSVVADMGLPGFSVKDLEEGSMSSVVDCLLVLRDNLSPGLVNDNSRDVLKTPSRKKWRVPETDVSLVAAGAAQGKTPTREDRGNGLPYPKSQQKTPAFNGQKLREIFQLKRGSYADLPAAKISEMMHSNSLDNAPTQSLLTVVNGILDESIERRKGEIPHRVVYLLRKVVQEIERRLCVQAEHIRNQNTIIKTREEKYHSKIKALELLVNGTNEENQMAINLLHVVKEEKSKIEERRKFSEQNVVRLVKEKENAENMIAGLKEEMEEMNRLYEQQLGQFEVKTKQMEDQLTSKVKEFELHVVQSNRKIEEIETASKLKSQLWNKKENIFQNYMNSQQLNVKSLTISSRSIKNDLNVFQMKWKDEMSNLGSNLKCLVDAAENYHKVLAENQKLFNEMQELKGNIRVYCRVRPFLPGQDKKSTTIDYIGERGDLLISNPLKQGKDGHRMFKFNKVFSSFASQAEVFSDIQPLIRSVLDGFNVCIFAYGQTGSGKTYTMSGPSMSKTDWGVNYRALSDLFDISLSRRNVFSYEVGVQMVEIYNEQVRDLLSNDIAQKRLGIWSTSQPNGLVVPDASLHSVTSTSDVLDLMEIGLANRAVGSTALNERSSRSHSILTVHVRGLDMKNGSTSRGCLHLIDLAGSERVERSEATGDRLKEAQHINKSLSALGDVIFALAQKNAHVPYRNSKLTQVLQSSLGGQAKTLMFVQINPDVESYSETISTLKFAERVSGVELGAARSNKEGKDMKELLEQVSSLKDTISRKDMEIEQLQLMKDNAKPPNLFIDKPSKFNSNQASLVTLNQRITLSDHLSYAEVNADAGHTSPIGIAPVRLDEADYEENVSGDEMTMYTVPSRVARSTLTKTGQPTTSRSKPRDSVLKTPSQTKPPSSQLTGGSSARTSKRWQK